MIRIDLEDLSCAKLSNGFQGLAYLFPLAPRPARYVQRGAALPVLRVNARGEGQQRRGQAHAPGGLDSLQSAPRTKL